MFGRDKDKIDVIETLPMVPLRDVVVFPHMMIPFVIGRPSSIKALEYALVKGKRIFLSAQHDATRDNPGPDEIHTLGTICNIVQSLKLPDGNVKVLVEGLDRGRALEFKEEQGFFKVVVKLIPRQVETRQRHRGGDVEGHRALRAVREALEQPPLRRHAGRGAGRGPGQAGRHHRLPPGAAGGGEAEPARDLLARRSGCSASWPSWRPRSTSCRSTSASRAGSRSRWSARRRSTTSTRR